MKVLLILLGKTPGLMNMKKVRKKTKKKNVMRLMTKEKKPCVILVWTKRGITNG